MSRNKRVREPKPELEGRRLGRGEKILILLGVLTLFAAALVVPEVREFCGLKPEKPPIVVAVPQAPAATNAKQDLPLPKEDDEPAYKKLPMKILKRAPDKYSTAASR